MSRWVARIGITAFITTDRGKQLESHLFDALTKLLGIQRIRTYSHNSAANGVMEHFYRQLKVSVIAHAQPISWLEESELRFRRISELNWSTELHCIYKASYSCQVQAPPWIQYPLSRNTRRHLALLACTNSVRCA